MSNSGAGGGPAVIPPVESLLFWKLQIVSFIFSRDGLAHCFSEGGVWQNTACGEFLRSIRQNLSEICLQPEKYLWIIGQKIVKPQRWEEECVQMHNIWVGLGICRKWSSSEWNIFSAEDWGHRRSGLERFGFLLLFHNHCHHNHHYYDGDYFKKGHVRILWPYIWNQHKTGTVKLPCLYFL